MTSLGRRPDLATPDSTIRIRIIMELFSLRWYRALTSEPLTDYAPDDEVLLRLSN